VTRRLTAVRRVDVDSPTVHSPEIDHNKNLTPNPDLQLTNIPSNRSIGRISSTTPAYQNAVYYHRPVSFA
jgi:hypothetical protein